MTRALIVSLLLLMPASAEGQSETAHHVLIASYMITSGADLAVTTYGLGAGRFREANPLLRPFEHRPVGMAVVKMGIGAGVSTLLLKHHRRTPKRIFWTAVGLTALNSYITYRNAKLLQPLTR